MTLTKATNKEFERIMKLLDKEITRLNLITKTLKQSRKEIEKELKNEKFN